MKSKHASKHARKAERSTTMASHHFPGASKSEQHILQELAHVLEDLPTESVQESVLPHVRAYGIVRDTFLESVHQRYYDITIDREFLSYEEKKQFNSILALALEYLTDSNQQLFSKKEFQYPFGLQGGYKLYSAMITTLQRHDMQALSAALEGTKLFLKKKASFVRGELQRLAGGYQNEILEAFAA